MKKRYSIILIGLANICFGQIKDFAYQKDILNGVEGWNRIQLADEMYSKINPSLSDIRIFGITSSPKKDTIEMPYVVNVVPKVEEAFHEFRIINRYTEGNTTSFIVQPQQSEAINYIDLEFDEKNFDWKVSIEGSEDKVDWKPILQNARVMSIQNNDANFKYTHLDFPLSEYKYFRITVNAKDCKLTVAKIRKKIESIAATRNFQKVLAQKTIVQKKETLIQFSLTDAIPISELSFEVLSPQQYYRPMSLCYTYDSVQSDKGVIFQRQNLFNGSISSLGSSKISFANTIAQHFEIKIYNEDNQPLDFIVKSVSGEPYSLISNFTKADQYFICYGNDTINAPSYDLKYFANPTDVRYNLVRLGETVTKNKVVAKTPHDRNKKLLWVVIVATVLLLGAFTIKMLKEK